MSVFKFNLISGPEESSLLRRNCSQLLVLAASYTLKIIMLCLKFLCTEDTYPWRMSTYFGNIYPIDNVLINILHVFHAKCLPDGSVEISANKLKNTDFWEIHIPPSINKERGTGADSNFFLQVASIFYICTNPLEY